jgi:threonine dehydrogenase-like Zn-dependent dehydrogenase
MSGIAAAGPQRRKVMQRPDKPAPPPSSRHELEQREVFSKDTAIRAVRPGGNVGYVGAPAGGSTLDMGTMYFNNVSIEGGIAIVRDYIPELLRHILNGTIRPGKVLDLELPLAEVADAYRAIDERRAIKAMLRPHG